MVNSQQQVLLKEEGHDLWGDNSASPHALHVAPEDMSDTGRCLIHVHVPSLCDSSKNTDSQPGHSCPSPCPHPRGGVGTARAPALLSSGPWPPPPLSQALRLG